MFDLSPRGIKSSSFRASLTLSITYKVIEVTLWANLVCKDFLVPESSMPDVLQGVKCSYETVDLIEPYY